MSSNRAFTLLELLVVITIIGILSSIVIVSMSGSTDSATIAKGKAYAQQVHALLGANAVGIWNFDEEEIGTCSDGSDVCDVSGYGNHGTFYGDTQFVNSNIERYALSFDGTGDYVNCGNGESLDITDVITLEAWVKLNEYTGTANDGIAGRDWQFQLTADTRYTGVRYNFFINSLSGQYIKTQETIGVGVWHHVVGTYNKDAGDNNLKIYVNGVLDNSSTKTDSANPTENFLIGNLDEQYIDGLIDNVRIYSEALPATEIQKHYVQGLENLLVNQAITRLEYDQRMEEFNQSLVLYEQ